jgi:hypothetical protein
MSTPINYIVTYDSDISQYTPGAGSFFYTASGNIAITNIQFSRNIAPSDDNATITLVTPFGTQPQKIDSAREIYIYRLNSDGSTTLKFRGMTTNPTYEVSEEGVVTTIQVQGLWYMLSTRLFQIAGKSPPPLQPNTNPYLVYLNPTLGLNFGTIWSLILASAFQGSYSTGHLPPFKLPNTDTNGVINQVIKYFTDFDRVIVNDNMNVQYQSISAVVDRLVQSAIFNANGSVPFLAEYRLDIGDYPYPFPNAPSYPSPPANTYTPNLPTLTVMLFDPVHSKLGNGQNRTGLTIGDNSLDPAGTSPAALQFPMSYVEFGVTNGYQHVDTVVFTEGDNMTDLSLTYDYTAMNNSYVLTGGSFQGSDVVAIPIENQRSIAEYGLKQTNQTLQNVVDPGEIQRYVGTSINFFQHPIPNIVIKPDLTYLLDHPLYAGDYVLINAPSLVGVIEDSNGMPLNGSYNTSGTKLSDAFTARIKTIDTSWDIENGEAITLTFTFPIQNVPLSAWNDVTAQKGANGGAMQFMYTTVVPSLKTLFGRDNQNIGAATYQGGADFINNRNNPFTALALDYVNTSIVYPDSFLLPLSILAQTIPNNVSAVDGTGNQVKGDGLMLFQFLVENDIKVGDASSVWMTVLQPDGMAIYDSIINLQQQANILSLISVSHKSASISTASAPILDGVSGQYLIILRNSTASGWCPIPLFSYYPGPTGGNIPENTGDWFVYCPTDGSGNEIGMSYASLIKYESTGGAYSFSLQWPAVANAAGYNVYREVGSNNDILGFRYIGHTTQTLPTVTITITNIANPPLFNTQPYGPAVQFNATYPVGGVNLSSSYYYWYVITAVNPAGIEVGYSATNAPTTSGRPGYGSNWLPNPQPEPGTVQPIQIEWPTVPYAQSYNIYRYGTTSFSGGSDSLPSYNNFQLLASNVTSPFVDDGSYVPSTTLTLADYPFATFSTNPYIIAANETYSTYVNYSFQGNPVSTQTIATAQIGNTNTNVTYDPTQQRVYQTTPYVAP